jgi:hypothetical protein
MDLTKLNLNEPQDPKPNVNFSDQNAVETFLESEKFRPCANLRCAPVNLNLQQVFMPMCDEGRFHRQEIAIAFVMPSTKVRHLSPWTYMHIPSWAPHISCPPDCKGYRNRTVAKTQKAGGRVANWLFEHVMKPGEFVWAAVWARLFK